RAAFGSARRACRRSRCAEGSAHFVRSEGWCRGRGVSRGARGRSQRLSIDGQTPRASHGESGEPSTSSRPAERGPGPPTQDEAVRVPKVRLQLGDGAALTEYARHFAELADPPRTV